MSAAPAPGALPPVRVVPLRKRHLRAVMGIEVQAYTHPWTHSLFLSELALPASRVYLAAQVDRVVVGYAGMMFAPDEAHVTTIAVDPEWRRRHVATALLVELTREAIDRGFTAMTLEVRAGARDAQALYRRFGFTPEGARRDYYQHPTEDAIVMWVRDMHTPAHARLLRDLEARS
ncbi:MAG: ribosomal protein S18-alanine N-acetyltransferase [Acidimicrobiia bacterium]